MFDCAPALLSLFGGLVDDCHILSAPGAAAAADQIVMLSVMVQVQVVPVIEGSYEFQVCASPPGVLMALHRWQDATM